MIARHCVRPYFDWNYQCVLCDQREAHVYCTLCRHWFHDKSKFLPTNEEKMIAVPTGKWERDGREQCIMVEDK